MLAMGTSASILGNLAGGLLAVYFVITALTTVRPVSPWTRRINVAALTVAVGLALGGIWQGVRAYKSPGHFLDGVPFLMHFFLASVLVLAAVGDLRTIRFGLPRGRPRLARHLWRR